MDSVKLHVKILNIFPSPTIHDFLKCFWWRTVFIVCLPRDKKKKHFIVVYEVRNSAMFKVWHKYLKFKNFTLNYTWIIMELSYFIIITFIDTFSEYNIKILFQIWTYNEFLTTGLTSHFYNEGVGLQVDMVETIIRLHLFLRIFT
jgi:hypothetical protein